MGAYDCSYTRYIHSRPPCRLLLWLLRIDNNKKKDIFTEDEIRTIVNVSQQEGVIESNEKKIINNLFDFGDSTAKDVMIPRIDMTLADVSSSYDDIISLFRQTMYTRTYL
ncbi:MAG: hypothetical protein ACLT33_12280 [Lachnospira pectinoschiza]